jgi:hypothetical protein
MNNSLQPIERKRDNELDLIYRISTGEIDESNANKSTNERIGRMRYLTSLVFAKKVGKVWLFKNQIELIAALKLQYPDVKEHALRKDIELFNRLHPMIDKVDFQFEKMLNIHSIKENINAARLAGDLKVVASENRTLATVLGVDKDLETGSGNMIINVINYDPESIGARRIDNMDVLIEKILKEDRDKEESFYTDFENVTTA